MSYSSENLKINITKLVTISFHRFFPKYVPFRTLSENYVFSLTFLKAIVQWVYNAEDSHMTVQMPHRNKIITPLLIIISYLLICFKYFIPENSLDLPPYCHNGGNRFLLKLDKKLTQVPMRNLHSLAPVFPIWNREMFVHCPQFYVESLPLYQMFRCSFG